MGTGDRDRGTPESGHLIPPEHASTGCGLGGLGYPTGAWVGVAVIARRSGYAFHTPAGRNGWSDGGVTLADPGLGSRGGWGY